MKQKVFKGILKLYFYIGVNVIGIPDFHIHNLAIYKTEQVKRFSKWIS